MDIWYFESFSGFIHICRQDKELKDMIAEIITIGNELLIGDTINTNASWIGSVLTDHGIRVDRVVTIGDDQQKIIDELDEGLKKADLIIITGGLGPTHDDITKESC